MMESEALQLQMDEFACVESMFLDARELTFDAALKHQYELHLARPAETPRPSTKFEFTIRFVALPVGGQVPELEIAYPAAYPLGAHVGFIVRCASLSRALMEQLQTELACVATAQEGELVVLQLYQCMADLLQGAIAQQLQDHTVPEAAASVDRKQSGPRSLGRRAIYFHHIIASTKRRVVKEYALELQLGGFSKIGWPGVVVVEGDEENVQEYVRRLQHLRWKQMVVRGEQTERVDGNGGLDALRRLPRAFCEFPETAMSEAAALCRDAGLEELFLSVMKIYRAEPKGSSAQEDDDAEDEQNARGKTKGRKAR